MLELVAYALAIISGRYALNRAEKTYMMTIEQVTAIRAQSSREARKQAEIIRRNVAAWQAQRAQARSRQNEYALRGKGLNTLSFGGVQ